MNLGISTGCFFPEKTDVSLKMVGNIGAKYTEIFFNTESELEESFVYSLKQIADVYGIKIVSIHPYTSAIETFMFFSRNDYKLEDSIKFYEKYFKACRILNCKYVVIHGCFYNADYMDMERYCKNLNALAEKAREYDVCISQENVVHYKCGYIENLRRFDKLKSDNIKYVFDIKQAVRAKQDIYEIVNLMGNNISHMHISDFNDTANSLVPSQGNFDFKTFFSYMENNFKTKYALIEVYNDNIKDVNMLKNALKNLSLR